VARRRDEAPALPPGARPFTDAELARIAALTSTLPRGHPSEAGQELDRIHEAAGRRRTFKAWELARPGEHDPGAAFLEETADG